MAATPRLLLPLLLLSLLLLRLRPWLQSRLLLLRPQPGFPTRCLSLWLLQASLLITPYATSRDDEVLAVEAAQRRSGALRREAA